MEYKGFTLPEWGDSFNRKHFDEVELPVIEECVERFLEGNKLVLCDSPTGSGKSAIGECVRQRLNAKGIYLCSTLSLMDQFLRDMTWASEIRGRANYLPYNTEPGAWEHTPTCADCDLDHRTRLCTHCGEADNCPYLHARDTAEDSDIAVSNYAYWIGECRQSRSKFTGRQLVICDECVVEGTQISTPNGTRAIETICPGDLIYGMTDSGQIVTSRVLATSDRETQKPLWSVNGVTLTDNHPIWTPTGYQTVLETGLNKVGVISWTHGSENDDPYLRVVQAEVRQELPQKPRSALLLSEVRKRLSSRAAEKGLCKDLRVLWRRVHEAAQGGTVLLSLLREPLELVSQSSHNAKDSRRYGRSSKEPRSAREVSTLATRSTESHLRPQGPAEGAYRAGQFRLRTSQWRKRTRGQFPSTPPTCSLGCWLGDGACCSNQANEANALQDRHCGPSSENRRRSRWRISQGDFDSFSGQTQRRLLGLSELDSCQSEEQGSASGSRGSSESHPFRRVFNLKTTSGNYFANGVLVHNCDLVPGELANHISVEISPSLQGRLNIDPPQFKTKEESWPEWFTYAIPRIENSLARLPDKTLPDKRRIATVQRLLDKLSVIADDTSGWVYETDRAGKIEWKPVTVDKVAPEAFWRHGKAFLAMSASIGSPHSFVSDLGFDGSWAYVEAPSTFDPARRPIYFCPVVEMRKSDELEAWPKMAEGVCVALDRYPDDRVLILPHSYPLAKFIHAAVLEDWTRRGIERHLFVYTNAGEREATLAAYERTPGSVLIGASMERGIDLKDDLGRCVIICKTPFPNLGSKQVSKRRYETPSGQLWYLNETARSLLQASGRAMRHEDDYCDVLVLDSVYSSFYSSNKMLFRQWYKDAVHLNSDVRFELMAEMRRRRREKTLAGTRPN